MERKSRKPSGNVKQEPDYESDQGEGCSKDTSPKAQVADNNDNETPGTEKESGVCEEYEEVYSCVRGYLPISRVEYLQVMPSYRHLKLGKQDKRLDVLSEYKCSNGSNIVSSEGDTSLTDMSGSSNEESRMKDVGDQEIAVDNKKVHNIERPFTCDICGVGFVWNSHLNRHKRIHTGVKPYKCDVCGIGFARCEHLKDHKRIHTGEKPYKCDVCGARFTSNTAVKNHSRIHTGEKPYKCEVCGIGFARSEHLKNHSRIHTGEKPYKCDVCNIAFAQSSNLAVHKRIHV